MKLNSISVFRHGQSGYEQGNEARLIEDAHDLCAKPLYEGEHLARRQERAIEEVRVSARRLAATLSPYQMVKIISSPAGRTLHTAKIIYDTLEENGLTVGSISANPCIGEVANFTWELFEPLISGGTINFGDLSFEVNKEETNPRNLGYPDYFTEECVHTLPEEVLAKMPPAYVSRIRSFEKYSDITDRGWITICETAQRARNNFHVVFVTHDCIAMYAADKFTGGRQKSLVPGNYISLEQGERSIVVTEVGGITDGDNTTDFFGEIFLRVNPDPASL